ncbi:MAG: oligosaccharide flippase family protein [Symploca sp. SIO1C2]|nr:oligosaccharide flippase family protein [Symploca sp. SIO1C2]
MSNISASKIAKSSLWLTSSFVLAKSSQLISQVFLARLLQPEDFGIWGMVLVVVTLSDLFKDKATAQVLVQRGLDNRKLVDAVYSLGVNISVGMFIAQALIAFPLSQFFERPILFPLTALTGLVFVIGAGAGAHGAVLQRRMKFRELAICDTAAGLARFGGGVICATLGGGVWSFAVAEISFSLVDAFSKKWLSGYRFTYHLIPDSSATKEVWGYISSLMGINLAVYVNTNGDNFLVGKLLGAASLGYYNLAYQLAMLPTFALSQINRVNLSVLSQKSNEESRIYVTQVLEIYGLLYAPLYGLGFLVASWIIPVIYGQAWTPTVVLFQIVLVFAYTRGFMSILGTALNALNKPNINAAINWVLVPISLPAFFIGAKFFGVVGVAITAALIMGVVATIWFWVAISRAANWSLATLVQPILLPTFSTTLGLLTVSFLPFPASFSLLLQPIIFILIYGVALFLLSGGRIYKRANNFISHRRKRAKV